MGSLLVPGLNAALQVFYSDSCILTTEELLIKQTRLGVSLVNKKTELY
jgi:hypothetical protein